MAELFPPLTPLDKLLPWQGVARSRTRKRIHHCTGHVVAGLLHHSRQVNGCHRRRGMPLVRSLPKRAEL